MLKKEKFIISLMLQKKGLSEADTTKLINKFEEKGLSYEKIINNNINELIEYCSNNGYSSNYLIEMIMYAIKKKDYKKIIVIDNVLKEENYNKKEREYIEIKEKEVFKNSKENLKNKIKYFYDNNLKDLTLINPRSLSIALDLTHSRIEFFKIKKISLQKNAIRLLEDNVRFKYHFGVTSDDLRRMYPLPEKYLIKKIK